MIEYKLNYTIMRYRVSPKGTMIPFKSKFDTLEKAQEKKDLFNKFISEQTRENGEILKVSDEEEKYFVGCYRVFEVGDIEKIEKTVVG